MSLPDWFSRLLALSKTPEAANPVSNSEAPAAPSAWQQREALVKLLQPELDALDPPPLFMDALRAAWGHVESDRRVVGMPGFARWILRKERENEGRPIMTQALGPIDRYGSQPSISVQVYPSHFFENRQTVASLRLMSGGSCATVEIPVNKPEDMQIISMALRALADQVDRTTMTATIETLREKP